MRKVILNGSTIERSDILSDEWSMISVVLMTLVALTLWIALHFLRRNVAMHILLPTSMYLLRITVGAVALWLICSLILRTQILELTTSWSLRFLCGLMALCIETAASLYVLEREAVSKRVGLCLVSLRVLMVVLVACMLAQPVLSTVVKDRQEKYVAVLIDDSASMHLIDKQLAISEKLDLADALAAELEDRPDELGSVSDELAKQLTDIVGAADSLRALADLTPEQRDRQLALQRESLRQLLSVSRETISANSRQLSNVLTANFPINDAIRTEVALLSQQLSGQIVSPLLEVDQILASKKEVSRRYSATTEQLTSTATDLRNVLSRLKPLAARVDKAYYLSLPPEKRERLERAVAKSRFEIARNRIIGADGMKSLRDDLEHSGYIPRLYLFSGETREVSIQQLSNLDEVEVDRPASSPTTSNSTRIDDSAALTTDLTGALAKVREAISAEQLAGVVVVSDGRHNAESDLVAIAKQLALQNAPLGVLPIGSSRSPRNVSILEVNNPETILVDDSFEIKARVNVVGMKGTRVRVRLSKGEEVLAEKKVSVANDDYTTSIPLTHTPTEEGFEQYKISVEPDDLTMKDDEAFTRNSQRSFGVVVTDERTQVLLIEGRPRWEFRYLRSLLASREKTVELQSVLLVPDRVAEAATPSAVHASVSRPASETDATLPPNSEKEWRKFDVVVLGDVPNKLLRQEDLQRIERFVGDRGGTLVVIAGPNYMPHAYAHTPLADLLPITFQPAQTIAQNSPEPYFHFALSQGGLRSTVMQQLPDADANAKFWNSLPPMYWRHAITSTKPGAAVLAYANTADAQNRFAIPADADAQAIEELQKQRTKFERDNALVAVQKYKAGRVMMLCTDRTWRLRYRTGDKYHHRFWAQVLRWAESDKLQSGTSLVRLGTDRNVYNHQDPIVVRVRLQDAFHKSVQDDELQIKFYQDDQLVLTQNAEGEPSEDGQYEIRVGELAGHGQFRIELDSAKAAEILASEGANKVETTITLLPSKAATRELAELSADRETLGKIAAISGGAMVEIDRADELIDVFDSVTDVESKPDRTTVWDTWPWLALMFVTVSAEWMLRKKAGLI